MMSKNLVIAAQLRVVGERTACQPTAPPPFYALQCGSGTHRKLIGVSFAVGIEATRAVQVSQVPLRNIGDNAIRGSTCGNDASP